MKPDVGQAAAFEMIAVLAVLVSALLMNQISTRAFDTHPCWKTFMADTANPFWYLSTLWNLWKCAWEYTILPIDQVLFT